MKKRYVIGVLAVFIAFSCLGLKCQKVTDPATPEYTVPYEGMQFNSTEDCAEWCGEYYSGLLVAENERHQEAMQTCGDVECKKAETKTHQANVKEIQSARQMCVRSCHDQGEMGGGF